MNVALFSKSDLTLIGRLLARQQPDVAAELLSSIQPQPPHDTDQENIPYYFLTFCKIQNIESQELSLSRYNSEMVAAKKLLIACVLHIYCPVVFNQPVGLQNVKWGIVSRLSKSLHNTKPAISMLIQEVVTQYKVYDDFRDQVDMIVEKIKGGGDGQSEA